ncbi:hypothetical protein UT300007_10570 [Clostridium sp. CTA-7]
MVEAGGTYSFPREKWEMFYNKMVQPSDGKNFYCLIYTSDDKTIGEVSFHGYNSATKVARVNVKIHHRYRKNGYGEEALRLILEYYFLDFGGEAIIDTVITNESKKLLKKIGFEEISSFKNKSTYKLTKKNFLSFKISNKKSVAVLAYDNIDMLEYSIPFNIFSKVNEILKEDYFQIYSISDKKNININNMSIIIDKNFNEDIDKPNILVIPGGNELDNYINANNLSRYVVSAYNNCDYITTFSNGLYFLRDFQGMDGVLIPESNLEIKGTVQVNRSFVDNGKLMFASNIMGSIELCVDIVKKLAGEEVSKELCKKIGIF